MMRPAHGNVRDHIDSLKTIGWQGALNHRCSSLPLIQRSGASQVAADTKPISYSIVIPVFNEEAVLPVLQRRLDLLLARLHGPAEAIFVDDGSSDSGPFVLQALAKRDPRLRYIGRSRNFGHQVALTTGMDAAQGKAIVGMDADPHDPPEVVEQLIATWKEGYDAV